MKTYEVRIKEVDKPEYYLHAEAEHPNRARHIIAEVTGLPLVAIKEAKEVDQC